MKFSSHHMAFSHFLSVNCSSPSFSCALPSPLLPYSNLFPSYSTFPLHMIWILSLPLTTFFTVLHNFPFYCPGFYRQLILGSQIYEGMMLGSTYERKYAMLVFQSMSYLTQCNCFPVPSVYL